MHEIDFDNPFDISEPFFLEGAEFSGGGQGKAPKPPTKIRGSQHIQRQEKIRNIPRPMLKQAPPKK